MIALILLYKSAYFDQFTAYTFIIDVIDLLRGVETLKSPVICLFIITVQFNVSVKKAKETEKRK
jgi:hypothetical protein